MKSMIPTTSSPRTESMALNVQSPLASARNAPDERIVHDLQIGQEERVVVDGEAQRLLGLLGDVERRLVHDLDEVAVEQDLARLARRRIVPVARRALEVVDLQTRSARTGGGARRTRSGERWYMRFSMTSRSRRWALPVVGFLMPRRKKPRFLASKVGMSWKKARAM